jgi:hypothetical protein
MKSPKSKRKAKPRPKKSPGLFCTPIPAFGYLLWPNTPTSPAIAISLCRGDVTLFIQSGFTISKQATGATGSSIYKILPLDTPPPTPTTKTGKNIGKSKPA